MGLYNSYVLPKVIDWTCGSIPMMRQRQKVVPFASGKVLEIGIGSGLNLQYYDSKKVKHLTAIDPSLKVWERNKFDTNILSFEFKFIEAFAEKIPLENLAFDTVVITYTLCTIPDTNMAFEEIRRVLKPKGKLVFCEHGKAPDKNIQKWQNRINPVWKRLGGGCNLNRNIPEIIEKNGFTFESLETMYLPGWKPASFNFWGLAKLK